MQSLVERWRQKLTLTDDKQPSLTTLPPHPPPLPRATQQPSSTNELVEPTLSKKSVEKSKKSLHAQQGQQGQGVVGRNGSSEKRILTPAKKKTKNTKNTLLSQACEQIMEALTKSVANFVGTTSLNNKVKSILQQLLARHSQLLQSLQPPAQPPIQPQVQPQLQTSIMRESTLSTPAPKKLQKLHQQLQRKYFQSQKQRLHLKNKLQSLNLRYQNVQKQLQRYGKMQKLVDKCIEREQEMREENRELRVRVKEAEGRLVEQQRVFEDEIAGVRELVERIRRHMPRECLWVEE